MEIRCHFGENELIDYECGHHGAEDRSCDSLVVCLVSVFDFGHVWLGYAVEVLVVYCEVMVELGLVLE